MSPPAQFPTLGGDRATHHPPSAYRRKPRSGRALRAQIVSNGENFA